MALTYRYMDLYVGDNEWLDDPSNCDDEEWDDAWAKLKQATPHHICFTDAMYSNMEYGDKPEWIELTIEDEGLLQFKLARNLIANLEGATSIQFNKFFSVEVSPDFGGYRNPRLYVSDRYAWLEFDGKHSEEMIEVGVSEQMLHAIGE